MTVPGLRTLFLDSSALEAIDQFGTIQMLVLLLLPYIYIKYFLFSGISYIKAVRTLHD